MATVNPTVAEEGTGDGSVKTFTWAMVSASVEGIAFKFTEWADVCFTATGTWGGATLAIQGSGDGTTFVPLHDAAGAAAATATADKAMTIIERPLYMRPYLTTAGAGATITVIATARRATPMRT